MPLRYGVVALARPTFDVPFAEEVKERAFAALDAAGIATVGPRALLFDAEAAERALGDIGSTGDIDLLLILQVTFTDATMTVKIATDIEVPLALWAFPEPRLGGRLRLNAFCGLNLAAHALGKAGVAHGWLYADPDAAHIADSLRDLSQPAAITSSRAGQVGPLESTLADRVLESLQGSRITVLGQHPEGFDTCSFDAALLHDLAGIVVEPLALDRVFESARKVTADRVATSRDRVASSLAELDAVDQEKLDRSFRVFSALEDLQSETGAKGLAVRCWPEMFTEYGCAACGPMAMMNEKRVPAACEADVHGSISQLMLQELADRPAWMADLVDIDVKSNTAVLWHCGLAPLSMADPEAQAEATIHTNRRMPLLHQFPLRPGRVTLARLSQARNEPKLMIAGAEVLKAPMAFTGTSGVIRFDRPASDVCVDIMAEGLEHHFALAYGDYREALRAIAARLDLPLLELA